MNIDKLNKYVEAKISLLQNTDYYEEGLSCEELRCNDALGSFEEGFELGKCQGELDTLIMVHILMKEKG